MTLARFPPVRILILASYAPSLINFRGALLEELVAIGWDVVAAAPDMAPELRERLDAMGVRSCETPLARSGMNPLADFAYWRSLVALFLRERPDVMLAYTAKPVIWGTLAARAARIQRTVAMITGLGYAFTAPEQPNWKHRLASLAAGLLYKFALPRADHVFFQNPDDRDLFQEKGFTPSPSQVSVIAGSGVDLSLYPASDSPRRPVFLMLARLLKAKGVREYAHAARALKRKYPQAEFRLGGTFDPSPDGLSKDELDTAIASGLTYLGPLEDVRPALAACSVYVLPSYREGTPRSVLEALATGRAVVTTDAPGCRETVTDGVNGFLVPPRDTSVLEHAMERFILEPQLIQTMGRASLELARTKYDVRAVNAQIIDALNRPEFVGGPNS